MPGDFDDSAPTQHEKPDAVRTRTPAHTSPQQRGIAELAMNPAREVLPTQMSGVSISDEQINNWFTYHPSAPKQQEAYVRIRAHSYALAMLIRDFCPPGADTTAAIRKVREAVMTANAAIACGGK